MARFALAALILALFLGPLPSQGQPARQPEERFVVVGLMIVDGAPGLAWLVEPRLTQNRPVAVRQGESIGPYQVARILDDRVELTGPEGPVWVPLLTTGGPVVAAAGPPTAGAVPVRPSRAPAAEGRPAPEAGVAPAAALPPAPRNPLAQPIETLRRRVEALARQQTAAAEAQRAQMRDNPPAEEPAGPPTPTAPATPPTGTLPSGPRVHYPPQGSLMDFLAPR
jgi:hypothetical protein